ncbi:SusD/RagB family nutrient-binding outer membrane lipoprotein [Mucilaginibacter sp. RS28]|uniref:SusD/RagB family nutrient-binding outer membrane lipoprotein n=1 Tax=Mucilaginibacter straminoryzae TaxID=2932774 RepID=A0A9X1X3W6_9SPHI|nr:SusD/RagB family nutrient-binding outer membrane lipoprotein [Mucilaginibacter straminoryzae]MCJ8209188.1 SusD/RagB family nutrient-binding outer membrane lipoprotein [Mucilaginibacter straminoryzae]
MKKYIKVIIFAACLYTVAGCDKGFKELNVNPNNPTSLDPVFLFSNAELLTYASLMETEATVVQQFVDPFGGVTSAFNFNVLNQTYTVLRWNNAYPNSIKLLEQVLASAKSDASRPNLYNEARIWRAYNYMMLVDTYGDVPYSQAGQAYLNTVYLPKYDKQQDIYTNLVNEITTATAALDPAKDVVTGDVFYGGNIAQWKRLGYSLLLRIGMRYTKIDPAKAKTIVQTAFNGGVMQSNADNCYLKYNNTYTNPMTQQIQQLTNTYYLAEPFVTQLKSTGDPRLKYISAIYTDPGKALTLTPDTTSANQYGLPVGYDSGTLPSAPGFRGGGGSGFKYSQVNYSVFGKVTAPQFFITYAQTQLLLAEAAYKGFITGSPGSFYANGVKAAMDQFTTYDATAIIPASTENAYLNNPLNAYSDANALKLINTQYWITSFGNGAESWANFRRSGYPTLAPNTYPGKQIKGSFVRRYTYPQTEAAINADNYRAAVASIGADDLDTPVFWDK